MEEKYITPQQAAEITGYSREVVTMLLHQNRIPGAKKIDHKVIPLSWAEEVALIKHKTNYSRIPRKEKRSR